MSVSPTEVVEALLVLVMEASDSLVHYVNEGNDLDIDTLVHFPLSVLYSNCRRLPSLSLQLPFPLSLAK